MIRFEKRPLPPRGGSATKGAWTITSIFYLKTWHLFLCRLRGGM